jgi:ribosomal protein S15P/S13E
MSRQLALDSQQLGLEIYHEVVASTLTKRAEHCEAKLNNHRRDRSLRRGSLLTRCQLVHALMLANH